VRGGEGGSDYGRDGRTGIPAERETRGCGEVAEFELGIGMTRMAGVCCMREMIK
jgi:hypothetical protein